jgi:DNA polymerase-3 subunit alpha
MDVMDFRSEDLNFFRKVLERNHGDQKLKFYIKNIDNDAGADHLEVQSMKHSVNLNGDLIKEIQLLNKYDFYLN